MTDLVSHPGFEGTFFDSDSTDDDHPKMDYWECGFCKTRYRSPQEYFWHGQVRLNRCIERGKANERITGIFDYKTMPEDCEHAKRAVAEQFGHGK